MATTESQTEKTLFQKTGYQSLIIDLLSVSAVSVFWVATMAFKTHEDILTWPPSFLSAYAGKISVIFTAIERQEWAQ